MGLAVCRRKKSSAAEAVVVSVAADGDQYNLPKACHIKRPSCLLQSLISRWNVQFNMGDGYRIVHRSTEMGSILSATATSDILVSGLSSVFILIQL